MAILKIRTKTRTQTKGGIENPLLIGIFSLTEVIRHRIGGIKKRESGHSITRFPFFSFFSILFCDFSSLHKIDDTDEDPKLQAPGVGKA
jgi:hypothetical protein